MDKYYARKRTMVLVSLTAGAAAGLAGASFSPIGAIAEFTGALCGVANALLSMRGNERLLGHRSVAAFVLSSVLRIALFGIVPVEFALHGPAWTMAAYYGGFFTPLLVYALLSARHLSTDSNT
jgi:hypothetical protein